MMCHHFKTTFTTILIATVKKIVLTTALLSFPLWSMSETDHKTLKNQSQQNILLKKQAEQRDYNADSNPHSETYSSTTIDDQDTNNSTPIVDDEDESQDEHDYEDESQEESTDVTRVKNRRFDNVRVNNYLDTQNVRVEQNAYISGDLSVTHNTTFGGTVTVDGTFTAPDLNTDNLTIDTLTKNGITVAWPAAAGVAGSILTNDGVGNLTFTPAVGGGNVSTALDFTTNNRLITTDTPSSATNIKQTAVTLDGSNNISGVNTLNATKLSGSLDGSSVTKTTVAVADATQVVENATNTATPNTLVLRDGIGLGGFAAGTITATRFSGPLTGAVTGNADTATSAGSAVSFSGSLSGNVTGPQTNTLVTNVGGSIASAVSAATVLANQATDVNTGGQIVKRTGAGNFSGGTITAETRFMGPLTGAVTGAVTGNVTGSLFGTADYATYATTSTNFTGVLAGDVTGLQSVTYVNTIQGTSAATVLAGATLANAATANDEDDKLVKRNSSGNFATNMITLNGDVTTNPKNATTKEYVDERFATGFEVKEAVQVVSLSSTTTAGLITIDGYSVSHDDRVLLIGQDDEIYNGLWLAQSTDWLRPDDFLNGTLAGQAYVLTLTGLEQAGSSWVCDTPAAFVGTDTLTFTQFSVAGRTTGANVGTGAGTGQIFRDKTGIYINFKSLAPANNFLTINNDPNQLTLAVTATSDNQINKIVSRDSSGNFYANNIIASLTGHASLDVPLAGGTMTGDLMLANQKELRLQDAGSNYIGLKAPTTIASTYALSLPTTAPVAGQYLHASSPTTTSWQAIDALPSINKIYYVSLAGNDSTGDGSLSAPFLTIKKAINEANAIASTTNPIVISIGAGIFTEDNSGGPLAITADNINIVGESMLGTILEPSSVTNVLFTTTATNVEICSLTLQSPAGSTQAAITVIADEPGKYCFKDLSITSFAKGFDISCIGATHPTLFLNNTRFIDNGISISNNDAVVTISNGYILGSSTGTPGNTGITSTGNDASTNIFNTIISTCTTGIVVTGAAKSSILSCEFEKTDNSIVCDGASTTQITGCNFFRNPENAVNVAASGAGTVITAESCNFYCSEAGSPRGTAFKATAAGEIVATSHIIRNAVLALECGTTGDTVTTVLKAGSVFLIGNTMDIQQTGTSLLRFISGAFDANKVIIDDPTYVSIASYSRPGEFGNIIMSIGNAKDVSQPVYEIFQGPSDHYPHLQYEPDYYGTKGTVYKNDQGTPTFNGTQALSNNAYSYVITTSREKETGIKLLSDTSSTIGDWQNIRGWSIAKTGTLADLAFTYTDNDQGVPENQRGPYILTNFNGRDNQVEFPVATGTQPTYTTAHLIWAGDTALYRSADATLKVDNNLVVNNNLTVNSLTPTAGVVHNSAAGVLSSSLILNDDVAAGAGIVDTKLATISAAGKVLDSATTATSANIADKIVKRDISNNFAAGMITSSLTGMVTGTASFNVLKIGDTMTGALTLPAGSAASPSLKFANGTNTGFSSPTENKISFDANGVEKMTIDATTVTATTTFISAAACIMAKEVCFGGLQVDATNGITVTVADGISILLKTVSSASYAITMPANPINGQLLTIILGGNFNIPITYPSDTVYYEVDRLRTQSPMDQNSNGQSVTYVYYSGTWYRYSRG